LWAPPNHKCDSEKILGVPTEEEIAENVNGCDLCIGFMVESVINIIIIIQ
jgi:hypothetical protein